MDKDAKLEIVKGRKVSLDSELYAAGLDLKLAQAGGQEHEVKAARGRVEAVEAKREVLAAEEKSLKG